jgi:hypothetical protein
MVRLALITLTVSILITVPASADIPPLDQFTAWMENPGHVWVAPDGSGPTLDEAYAPGAPGSRIDARVHVELLQDDLQPIVDYPPEDIWLGDVNGTLVWCAGGTTADAPTDENGRTTISGPFRAGGHIPAGSNAQVYVAGNPVPTAPLPLTVSSPDVDGDLNVTLSDVTMFAAAFFGGYDLRYDFNGDAVVNLVDVTILAQAVNTSCR